MCTWAYVTAAFVPVHIYVVPFQSDRFMLLCLCMHLCCIVYSMLPVTSIVWPNNSDPSVITFRAGQTVLVFAPHICVSSCLKILALNVQLLSLLRIAMTDEVHLTIPKYTCQQALHLVTVESTTHHTSGGGRGGGLYDNLLGHVAWAPITQYGGGRTYTCPLPLPPIHTLQVT